MMLAVSPKIGTVRRGGRHAPDAARRLDAVEHRHAHVHQNEIEMLPAGEPNGLGPVLGEE